MRRLKVSIIIPTYNRATLLEETLKSISNQTFSNWECLIIDDGSTDNTASVVEAVSRKDDRFRYFKRPIEYLKGPSGCRNYGLSLANGEFINWFDSDDLMVENKLSTDIGILEGNNADFTISQTQFFKNQTGEKLGYWNNTLYSEDALNDFIMLKIGWSTNAPLWRRAPLDNVSLKFNESLMGPDDYDYHIQALHLGLKPIVINDVLVLNRVHSGRIENIRSKAQPKTLIILDLLKNQDSYNLSNECITYLKYHALYLIKNMYKNKNFKSAFSFSVQFNELFPNFYKRSMLLKMMFFGGLYKVTNRGYNFIDQE